MLGTTSNVARWTTRITDEEPIQQACVSSQRGRAVRPRRFGVRRRIVTQRLPATVDAAAHGTELDAQRCADLLVGQTFDVTQHHSRTELGRQGIQRRLQVGTQPGVVVDLLGIRLVGRHPVVILGQRLHPDAAAAADHVQEQVGGDAVQPAFERPRLVVLHRPEDADEGVLGQVLGVLLIAGQAVGQPVDPVGVLAHQLIPRRHRCFVSGCVEDGGAVWLLSGLNPVSVAVPLRVRHAGRAHQCGYVQILRVQLAVKARQLITARNAKMPRGIPGPAASTLHGQYRCLPAYARDMTALSFH